MLHRALPSRVLPFVLLLPLAAAQVSLPGPGLPRYVDYSQDLANPGAIVVAGTLGKWKEGKRERMADGQLGGSGTVAAVSGTQYFKVPVTAAVQPRAVLHGKADGVVLTFDVQVARLPDGKERRQLSNGTQLAEDALALFVIVPKKKGFELRHAIIFDPAADGSEGAQGAFVDTMRDFHAVNRRVRELTDALAAVDGSKDDAARTAALDALRTVLGKKTEMLKPQHDALLVQHVAPLEKRAQTRIDDAAKAAGAPK